MLLAYEYERLLINPANKAEVERILRELDFTDFLSEDMIRENNRKVERVRELGETKIYKRLLTG